MPLDVVAEDRRAVPLPSQPSAAAEQLQRARQRYESAQQRPDLPKIMSAADLEQRLASRAESTSSGRPLVVNSASPAPLATESSSDTNSSGAASHPFQAGTAVRHPRYGRGVVIDASHGSSRATVTVLFDIDDRQETFVAAHCPLQPLQGPGGGL